MCVLTASFDCQLVSLLDFGFLACQLVSLSACASWRLQACPANPDHLHWLSACASYHLHRLIQSFKVLRRREMTRLARHITGMLMIIFGKNNPPMYYSVKLSYGKWPMSQVCTCDRRGVTDDTDDDDRHIFPRRSFQNSTSLTYIGQMRQNFQHSSGF